MTSLMAALKLGPISIPWGINKSEKNPSYSND
jgi:hypothetical protein